MLREHVCSKVIMETNTITFIVQSTLPTEHGVFSIYIYQDDQNKEHVALVKGDIATKKTILCRIHSECLTGEVFHSLRCDCKEQLNISLKRIEEEKTGVVLYLRQEGRGIGLSEKIKAYNLQSKGFDTVEANIKLGHPIDARDFSIAAFILQDLGVASVKLMTNNPEKVLQLQNNGIVVVERVPIIPQKINKHNRKYLETKQKKMDHYL